MSITVIENLLHRANAESNKVVAVDLYRQALTLCNEIIETDNNYNKVQIIKAHTYKHLALEEFNLQKRTQLWDSALKVLLHRIKTDSSFDLVEAYSLLLTDFIQDDSSKELTFQDKIRELKNCIKIITALSYDEKDKIRKALLIARKASLIRYIALNEPKYERKNRLSESLDCANRAFTEHDNYTTRIEVALSSWQLGNYVETEDEQIVLLNKAINKLNREDILQNELAALTLIRVYRLNYKSFECCTLFSDLIVITTDYRRLLRNVYHYAEAAINMYFENYPSLDCEKHINLAFSLLNESINAGYDTPRNFINLAYIYAIKGKVQEGNSLLKRLAPNKHISWDSFLEFIDSDEIYESGRILDQGMAYGIDNSTIWSKLGTYFKKFLGEMEFAESLYLTAIHHNEKNVEAHTNLAKLLIEEYSSIEDIERALSHLREAEAFADRRFKWWRYIQEACFKRYKELYPEEYSKFIFSYVPVKRKPRKQGKLEKLAIAFTECDQKHGSERGDNFEKLFAELCSIYFEDATGKYNVYKNGHEYEVDFYFTFKGLPYRGECKWRGKTISDTESGLGDFLIKLDTTGYGLFISMSGFSERAVSRAVKAIEDGYKIILIDDYEVRDLFTDRLNFDSFLTLKKAHLDKYSNPYFSNYNAPNSIEVKQMKGFDEKI